MRALSTDRSIARDMAASTALPITGDITAMADSATAGSATAGTATAGTAGTVATMGMLGTVAAAMPWVGAAAAAAVAAAVVAMADTAMAGRTVRDW